MKIIFPADGEREHFYCIILKCSISNWTWREHATEKIKNTGKILKRKMF
jgi:hypothetical protein